MYRVSNTSFNKSACRLTYRTLDESIDFHIVQSTSISISISFNRRSYRFTYRSIDEPIDIYTYQSTYISIIQRAYRSIYRSSEELIDVHVDQSTNLSTDLSMDESTLQLVGKLAGHKTYLPMYRLTYWSIDQSLSTDRQTRKTTEISANPPTTVFWIFLVLHLHRI